MAMVVLVGRPMPMLCPELNMKGRMYREYPSRSGSQALSTLRSSLRHSRSSSASHHGSKSRDNTRQQVDVSAVLGPEDDAANIEKGNPPPGQL